MNEENVNGVLFNRSDQLPITRNNMAAVTYNIAQKKSRPAAVYTHADKWYAIAALILGFITLKALKMKGNRTTTVIFIVNLILSQSFLISSNYSVTLLCGIMIFVGNTYFSYASYHEGRRSVLNNAFRAAFISPFYNYGSAFEAIITKQGKNANKKGDVKKGLPVIVGLLLSLPLCIVVVFLLGTADKEFGRFDFSVFSALRYVCFCGSIFTIL